MTAFDVTIAGELNLDLILYGLPQELPTERELLATGFTVTLGSSSAILAHNLAALGSRVGFIGKVGDDPLGKLALERLAESGVDVSHVVRARETGSGVTVILPHARERHIITYPGTIFELSYTDLDLEYLCSARHFHMSSLFLHRALADRIPELFRIMKSRGLSTSLDTNDDPDDRWDGVLGETLAYVDVLFPNEREAQKIVGASGLDQAIALLAKRVPTVVVKLGQNGAVAVRGQNRFAAPSLNVKVMDTVGAGDSFDAGFLHEYVRGANLKTCLDYGNLAGAFSATACGGTEAFRNPAALREFVASHSALDTTARL
jgi:sugar/nucleoside kinase (ribokinase family)